MQKFKAIWKFLATLFMIFMIWFSYSLIAMVLQSHENENQDYIPENSDFVMRIDGLKLMKTSISSIIINEDEEVVQLIQKLFDGKGDQKVKNIGLAWNSDFIIFRQKINNHKVIGVLMNLDNPRTFRRNIEELAGRSSAYASNNSVGLILFEQKGKTKNPLKKKVLQANANKILASKSSFDFSRLKAKNKNSMVQTWSKSGLLKGVNLAKNTALSFEITDHKLIIEGDLSLNFDSKSSLRKTLKPDGFHISSNQMSDFINDSIISLMEDLSIPVKRINGFSINYTGLELISMPVYMAAPKFDALISFEDNFSVKKLIDSLLTIDHSSRVDSNLVNIRGLHLYYKQLDSKSIYLGTTKEPKFLAIEPNTPLRVVGSPSFLTNVEGKLKHMMAFIPGFALGENFFRKVSTIEIELKSEKDGITNVKGVIHFKKEHFALNSVLKLFLSSQISN